MLAVLPYIKPREQARLAARPAAASDAKEPAWWPGGAPADDKSGPQVVVFGPRRIGGDEANGAAERGKKKKT